MLSLPEGRHGVLPNQWLTKAVDAGVIEAGRFRIPPENVQPASLDLRLGEVAYAIQSSFLSANTTVESKVTDYVINELDLRQEGAVLEINRPYLIPLKERLELPPNVRGKANPKSSTGRVDVFTRLITDFSYRFDEVRAGYQGDLYLEVVPLSFAIRVREDLTLNQLRLAVGRQELSDDELLAFHRQQPLVFAKNRPVAQADFGSALGNGLFLSLDLRGGKARRVGYRARKNAPLLDMTRARGLDPRPFWEDVRAENRRIVLDPQRFYLLMSDEAVSIPPTLAAEMTAYDPTAGELRTHYAGFFDPGFGYDPEARFVGSRAALEVRAHDVPFMIEHGQRVCKLTFERMLEEPTFLYGQSIGSSYQRQEETLGKHFLPPRRVSDSSEESDQLKFPMR
jgi:dCTP deaminase